MIKKKRGISLIVLSITILVMAILAATAIISLEDSGIIGRSKNTVNKQNYTEEYTRLQVIKNGILTEKLGIITVDEYIAELMNKGLIETGITTNGDGSKSVTTKLGFVANIIQDGESNLIISLGTSNATITLNTNTLSGDITDGDVTKTLNVTTKDVTGDITWTTTNSNVAVVNGNNSIATVTMKRPGTAKIVATYGAAKAICNVTVTEKELSEIPVSANRPFMLGDYTCTVEWASSTAEYTIACDAIDKNNNPVYLLKAGMTKAEYDALGLKYRRGSWIFICNGTYIGITSTGYYSTGEILDTYAANTDANRSPMFQVNGNGAISLNSSGTISTNNSTYTTMYDYPYTATTYVDPFENVSDDTIIMEANKIMMFDGCNASTQSGSMYLPININRSGWTLKYIPGSMIYTNYELDGRLVKVASVDGVNAYIVSE